MATKPKPRKRAAAKRPITAAAKTASGERSLEVGDVVMFTASDGSVSGPGRVCTPPLLGTVCVAMPELGCMPISLRRLSLAPPGSDAPSCAGCDGC